MHSHPRALVTFGIVGAITAIIFFGVMWIVESKLHASYLVAVSIGYGLAVVFNFFAHQRITFQAHYNQTTAQLNRYIGMVFLNYLVTVLVVYICVIFWSLSAYVGVCFATVMTTVIAYILGRHWVFKRQG